VVTFESVRLALSAESMNLRLVNAESNSGGTVVASAAEIANGVPRTEVPSTETMRTTIASVAFNWPLLSKHLICPLSVPENDCGATMSDTYCRQRMNSAPAPDRAVAFLLAIADAILVIEHLRLSAPVVAFQLPENDGLTAAAPVDGK